MSTTILSSIVEHRKDYGDHSVVSFSVMGDPHAAAIVAAVSDSYDRPEVDWDSMVNQKVTFLHGGETMMGAGVISADEGTIRMGSGGLMYLPKGKRNHGFRLNPKTILDYVPGYSGIAELTRRVDAVVATLPRLAPLTKEDLTTLPLESARSEGDMCTIATMGRWGSRGHGETHKAVWLLDEYDPESDIAGGVLLVPEELGTSEHGSILGRDLLARVGRIVGFEPVTFEQAVAWTDQPHAEIFAAIAAVSNAAATV